MRRIVFTCLLAALACSTASHTNDPYKNRIVAQQRNRAARYMNAGHYASAASTLDSLTRARPNDSDLFEMLGDARRATKETDAAIRAYEQAIRLNYGAFTPHMKLGTLLMENGKTGRALTEFELAVKAEERDVLARYNYGVALYETGRKDEALAQWTQAGDIDPQNVRVASALAMGYSGVDDSTAAGYFERARSLGADDAVFHNNYGLLLERMGQSEQAASHFRSAISTAPPEKRDEYRRNLAVHELRVGNSRAARDLFTELVTTGGGLWSDTVYLARAHLALDEFAKAIEVLEPFALEVESGKIPASDKRIDRMPPTLDEALDILGMSWRGKKDKKRAVAYLERAVALKPDDIAHLNNYGVVLADGGMLPKARTQWRRVLEIDPHNATAKANLSAFGR
jgi:tetratricopeptide (TPR) repeat protein